MLRYFLYNSFFFYKSIAVIAQLGLLLGVSFYFLPFMVWWQTVKEFCVNSHTEFDTFFAIKSFKTLWRCIISIINNRSSKSHFYHLKNIWTGLNTFLIHFFWQAGTVLSFSQEIHMITYFVPTQQDEIHHLQQMITLEGVSNVMLLKRLFY